MTVQLKIGQYAAVLPGSCPVCSVVAGIFAGVVVVAGMLLKADLYLMLVVRNDGMNQYQGAGEQQKSDGGKFSGHVHGAFPANIKEFSDLSVFFPSAGHFLLYLCDRSRIRMLLNSVGWLSACRAI